MIKISSNETQISADMILFHTKSKQFVIEINMI